MSVISLIAQVSCDGCGARFNVEIDDLAYKPPVGWAVFDIVADAVRGGRVHGGAGFCSVEDGRMRCGDCTASEDAAWIAEHPDYVNSGHAVDGRWLVTTYGAGAYFLPTKPEFDTSIRQYPEAEPAPPEAVAALEEAERARARAFLAQAGFKWTSAKTREQGQSTIGGVG